MISERSLPADPDAPASDKEVADVLKLSSIEQLRPGDALSLLQNLAGEVQCRRAQSASPAPAKRTPEVVLRAMLASYSAAEADAAIEERRAPFVGGARSNWLYACRMELLSEIAHRGNDGAARVLYQPLLQIDYKARLAGTRPLDAPPMEV